MNLSLTIHQRTALVTVDTARAALGIDAESVLHKIERGEILHAFDISLHKEIREVRIWARDIIMPSEDVPLTTCVNCCIGTERDRLRATEVAQILCCARPTVKRLVESGLLVGPLIKHTQFVTRSSLAAFLINRHMR